jgi:hypothetical protein
MCLRARRESARRATNPHPLSVGATALPTSNLITPPDWPTRVSTIPQLLAPFARRVIVGSTPVSMETPGIGNFSSVLHTRSQESKACPSRNVRRALTPGVGRTSRDQVSPSSQSRIDKISIAAGGRKSEREYLTREIPSPLGLPCSAIILSITPSHWRPPQHPHPLPNPPRPNLRLSPPPTRHPRQLLRPRAQPQRFPLSHPHLIPPSSNL